MLIFPNYRFCFFLLNSLLLNNEFLMYLYNALESSSPLSNFLVSRMVNNINQRTLCSENSTTRKVVVGHFSVQLKLTLNLFHLKKIISCSQNTYLFWSDYLLYLEIDLNHIFWHALFFETLKLGWRKGALWLDGSQVTFTCSKSTIEI